MLYVILILACTAVLFLLTSALMCSPPMHADFADEEQWRRDPLSHPAIRGMSLREIADLPFDPAKIGSE